MTFHTVRCPFCDKVMTESTLRYVFVLDGEVPTNRYICPRCKRTVFYRIVAEGK